MKRLQNLEYAASGPDRTQLALIDVTKIYAADQDAYRAGDSDVLRRYGMPDPVEGSVGQIHTIVINVHPACRDQRREIDDVEGDGSRSPVRTLN